MVTVTLIESRSRRLPKTDSNSILVAAMHYFSTLKTYTGIYQMILKLSIAAPGHQ